MESDGQLEARSYEQQAHNLEQQGDHAGAIRLMERALLLRNPQGSSLAPGGPAGEKEHAERLLATERLVVKYNTVAVRAFKHDDYESSMVYLNNALKLTEPGAGSHFESTPEDRLRLRGTTFNNLGCLERRRGRMELALNYLQLSVEHGGEHSASTYLNMSAILNSLGRPSEAAGAARRAVGLYEASTSVNEEERATGVLGIAYHNLAMALETIEPQAAHEAYWAAFSIAKKELGPTSSTTQAIERNKNRFSQTMSRRTGYNGGPQHHQQGGGGSLLPPIGGSSAQNRSGSRTNRGRTPQNRTGAQTARQAAGGYTTDVGSMPSLPRRSGGGGAHHYSQPTQQSQHQIRSTSQQVRSPRSGSPVEESPMYSRTAVNQQSQPARGYNAPAPPRRQQQAEVIAQGTPSGLQLPRRQVGASKGPAPLPASTPGSAQPTTQEQQPQRQPTPPAEGTQRNARYGRPQQYNAIVSHTAADQQQQQQQQPTMTSRQRDEDRYQQPQVAQGGQQGVSEAVPSSPPGRTGATPSDVVDTTGKQAGTAPAPSQPKFKPQPPANQQLQPEPPGATGTRRSSAGNRHAAGAGGRYGTSTAAASHDQIPYSGLPGEDGRKEDLITFLANRLTSLLRSEEEYEARYVAAVKIQCLARRRQAVKQLANRRRKRVDSTADNKRRESLAAARVIRFFMLIMVKRKEMVRRQEQEQVVKDDRRDAAVKIQSCARRWLAKNKVKRLRIYYRDYNKSLRVLQCWFRQLLARKLSTRMKKSKQDSIATQLLRERRQRSATDIQRLFRAFKSVRGTDNLRGSVRAANEHERQSGRVYGAKRIQCAWRGYAVRKVSERMCGEREVKRVRTEFVERRRCAVVIIQRLTRGFLSRRRSTGVRAAFIERQYARMQARKNQAAVKIQSQIRRFLARRTRSAMHGKYYDHKCALNLDFRGGMLLRWARAAYGTLTVRAREQAILETKLKAEKMLHQESMEQSAQQQLEETRRQREKDAILRHQQQDLEWRQTVYKSVPKPPPVVPDHMKQFDHPGSLDDDPTVMGELPPTTESTVEESAEVEVPEAADPAAADDATVDVASPQEAEVAGDNVEDQAADKTPAEQEESLADIDASTAGEDVLIQNEQTEEVHEDSSESTEDPVEEEEEDPNRLPLPHEEGYQRPQPTEQPVRLQISAKYLEQKRKNALRERIETRMAEMERVQKLSPARGYRGVPVPGGVASADPVAVAAENSRRNKASFKIQAFFRGLLDRRRMVETRGTLERYLEELAEAGRVTPPPIESQMVFSVLDEVEVSQGPRLTQKRQQMVLSTLQSFGRAALAVKELHQRRVALYQRREQAAGVLCNTRRLVLAKKEIRRRQNLSEVQRTRAIQEEEDQLATELSQAVTVVATHCRTHLSEEHHNVTMDRRCKTVAQVRLAAFYRLIAAKQETQRRRLGIEQVLAGHGKQEDQEVACVKIQSHMRKALARSERARRATAVAAKMHEEKMDEKEHADATAQQPQRRVSEKRVSIVPPVDGEDKVSKLGTPDANPIPSPPTASMTAPESTPPRKRVSMAPETGIAEDDGEYEAIRSPRMATADVPFSPVAGKPSSPSEGQVEAASGSHHVGFAAANNENDIADQEAAAIKIQALTKGRQGRKAARIKAEERKLKYEAKVKEAREEESAEAELLASKPSPTSGADPHEDEPEKRTPDPEATDDDKDSDDQRDAKPLTKTVSFKATPGDDPSKVHPVLASPVAGTDVPFSPIVHPADDNEPGSNVEFIEPAAKRVSIVAPPGDDPSKVHPVLTSPVAGTDVPFSPIVHPPADDNEDNEALDRQGPHVEFSNLAKNEGEMKRDTESNAAAATVQRGFRVHLAKREAGQRRRKKQDQLQARMNAAEAEDTETFLKEKASPSPAPSVTGSNSRPDSQQQQRPGSMQQQERSSGTPKSLGAWEKPPTPRAKPPLPGMSEQDIERSKLMSSERKRNRAKQKEEERKTVEEEQSRRELYTAIRRREQLARSRTALESGEERRRKLEFARSALESAESGMFAPVPESPTETDGSVGVGSPRNAETIAFKIVEGCPQCKAPINDEEFQLVDEEAVHNSCLWAYCDDKGKPKCKHCNKHIYSDIDGLQLVPCLTGTSVDSSDSIHVACVAEWKSASRPNCELCSAQIMDSKATYISSEGEQVASAALPTATPESDVDLPAVVVHICHSEKCAEDLQNAILTKRKVAAEEAKAKALQAARAKEKEDQRRRVASLADRTMLQSRERRRTRMDDARKVFEELDYRQHYDYPAVTKHSRPMSGSKLSPEQQSLTVAVVGGCVQCKKKIDDEHFEYVAKGIIHDACVQPYGSEKQLPKCKHCELYIFSPANPAIKVINLKSGEKDSVHTDCSNSWQLASRPKCGYCEAVLMDDTCVYLNAEGDRKDRFSESSEELIGGEIKLFHSDCSKDVLVQLDRARKLKAANEEAARQAEARGEEKVEEAKKQQEADERAASETSQRKEALREEQRSALTTADSKKEKVEEARKALQSAESDFDSAMSITLEKVGAGCAVCQAKIEDENFEYVSEGVVHNACIEEYCKARGIGRCAHCKLYLWSDVNAPEKVKNLKATSLANQEVTVHADCVSGWKLDTRPNCDFCEEIILEDEAVFLDEEANEQVYSTHENKAQLCIYHTECAEDIKLEDKYDRKLTAELTDLQNKGSIYNRQASKNKPLEEASPTNKSQSLSLGKSLSLSKSRADPRDCTQCGLAVSIEEECMVNEDVCLHMHCVDAWEKAQLLSCTHCSELIRDETFTEMTVFPGSDREEALALHNDCVPDFKTSKRQGGEDYDCPMCQKPIEVDEVVGLFGENNDLVHQRCLDSANRLGTAGSDTMSIHMSGGCAHCSKKIEDEHFEHVQEEVIHSECLAAYCTKKGFHQCKHCDLYIYQADNEAKEVRNLKAISPWEQFDHIHSDCVSGWMLASRPKCEYCEELILDETATCLSLEKRVVPYSAEEGDNAVTIYHNECADDVKDSAAKDEEFDKRVADVRRRSSVRRQSQVAEERSQLKSGSQSGSRKEERDCSHCRKPVTFDQECMENDEVCVHIHCVDEWEKAQLIPCGHCEKGIADDTFTELTVFPGGTGEETLALHNDCLDAFKKAKRQGGEDYNCPLCGRAIEVDMEVASHGPQKLLVHKNCLDGLSRTGVSSASVTYKLSGRCPSCGEKLLDEHFEHVGEEVVHTACLNDFCKLIGSVQCTHCQEYIYSKTNEAVQVPNLKAANRGEEIDTVHTDCASAWKLASRPKCDFCEEPILDETASHLFKENPTELVKGYYKPEFNIYHEECALDVINDHAQSQQHKVELAEARRKSLQPLGACDQCKQPIMRGEDYQVNAEEGEETKEDEAQIMVHSKCLDDWQDARVQKCKQCNEPILGDYMECEVPELGTVFLHEGKCADLFAESLVPKCKFCFKPILDSEEGVTLEGEPYHEACANEVISAEAKAEDGEEK